MAVPKVRAGLCDGKADGIYEVPNNNNQFIQCSGGTEYDFKCATGLVFNPSTHVCVWPDDTHQPVTDISPIETPELPGNNGKISALNAVNNASPLPKGAPCQRRVCYFANWAQYGPTPETIFFPDDIDPDVCTHLIYAFAKFSGNKLSPYEWNDQSSDGEVGGYEKVCKPVYESGE